MDGENNLLIVRGAVPGAADGYVLIRKAIAAKPEPKPQAEVADQGQGEAEEVGFRLQATGFGKGSGEASSLLKPAACSLSRENES